MIELVTVAVVWYGLGVGSVIGWQRWREKQEKAILKQEAKLRRSEGAKRGAQKRLDGAKVSGSTPTGLNGSSNFELPTEHQS
jgi:hypothetical protein